VVGPQPRLQHLHRREQRIRRGVPDSPTRARATRCRTRRPAHRAQCVSVWRSQTYFARFQPIFWV
jgi:hypothetical protein